MIPANATNAPLTTAVDPVDTRTAPTPEKLHLLPAKEVAEGLTSMDAELLARISPEELHNGAWMKRGKKVRTSH